MRPARAKSKASTAAHEAGLARASTEALGIRTERGVLTSPDRRQARGGPGAPAAVEREGAFPPERPGAGSQAQPLARAPGLRQAAALALQAVARAGVIIGLSPAAARAVTSTGCLTLPLGSPVVQGRVRASLPVERRPDEHAEAAVFRPQFHARALWRARGLCAVVGLAV